MTGRVPEGGAQTGATRREFLTSLFASTVCLGLLGVAPVVDWYLRGHDALHCVAGAIDRVALTFDDGPDPRFTPAILDILAERDLKATFFVVGEHVHRYPAIARRIVEEGHELGYHSWAHHMMEGRPYEDIRREQDRCRDAISAATGASPMWYRPPRGHMTFAQKRVLGEDGLRLAMWNRPLEGAAFECDPDGRLREVCAETCPGDILLLHDGLRDRTSTVAALPHLLDGLQAAALKPIPLAELAESADGRHAAKMAAG